jgi:O-antigen ligase
MGYCVLRQTAFFLTFASAVSILFSIAVSQILLGLALIALLLSETPIRVPPIWLPLALFIVFTLISLLLSPDASAGLVQIRKMFVFTMLGAAFSVFTETAAIRKLFLAWAVTGALVAARGLVQFSSKLSEARAKGEDFYSSYIGDRITGFMSHWMTFGGLQMFALLLLTAFLLLAPTQTRKRTALWLICGAVMFAALVLGFTRSIWLATAVGGIYLLWTWRPVSLLALPILLGAGYLVAPASVKSRASSILRPARGDSNTHRVVTWRTGLEMIKAHPWFGVGPEFVGRDFDKYVPTDVPRPLPTGWYGHLHNIYLHYAAERGVFAQAAIIWFLLKMLIDFWKGSREAAGDRRFILHGAVAVVLATMTAGIFELNLGDSEVLTMFLVVAACGYRALEPESANAA